MRKVLIICLVFVSPIYAQDDYQSLIRKAQMAEATNPDSVIFFAHKAYQKNGERIEALYWIGSGLRLKGHYDSANFWIRKYQRLASTDFDLGNANMGLGGIHYGQSAYDSALTYFSNAAIQFQRGGHQDRYGAALLNMGIIAGIGGNNQKAKANYLRALEIFREHDLHLNQLPALSNLALIYEHEEKYDSALLFAQACFEIGDSLNLPYAKAQGLKSLAPAHIKSGDPELGLKLARQGKELFESMELSLPTATMTLTEAEALLALDRTDEALKLSEGLLRNEYAFKEGLFRLLAEIYKTKKDYSRALEYHEKYHDAYEKEEKQRNTEQLSLLQVKYETAQNEYAIVKLENELITQRATKEAQQRLFGAIAFILLFVALLGWFVYQKRLIKAREQSAIHKQQLLRSQINPHFIFNSLSSIRGFLFGGGDSKPAITYLGKFAKLMRMILELSAKEWVTLEEELKALELYLQIQQLRFNQSFDFKLRVDKSVNTGDTLVPPLTAQPFIENAIEHGLKGIEKDGKIEISCLERQGKLIVSIKDNGIGIDHIEPRKNHQSKAIHIFKERLSIIGRRMKKTYSFSISDLGAQAKDSGTLVTYELPLVNA